MDLVDGWSDLIVVAQWVIGFVLCLRVRTLGIGRGRTRDLVSVVIPARNEEAALPFLLASLGIQTQNPHEVIVVDDASADATAAVAALAGADVITSAPLPPGWTGKAWALHQGAAVASGDVLVFLDADTEPSAELIERLVAQLRRDGGMVSVEPFHRMERADERLSAFFNLVSVMGTGVGSANPHAQTTGAFGPCIAIKADDYRALGGHESVRSTVVEDVALARTAARAGLATHAYAGRDAIAFRMYPNGFSQLVEGWVKNIVSGAAAVRPLRALLTFAWLAGVLSVGVGLAVRVVGLPFGGSLPTVFGLVAYAAFAGQIHVMLRQIGNFGPLPAVLFPAFAVFFVALFVWSAFSTFVLGRVQWKGRTVDVRHRS